MSAKIRLPEAILAKFRRAGRKGGKVRSEAKTAACRLNASRPRKKRDVPRGTSAPNL